jgi:protein SCO1
MNRGTQTTGTIVSFFIFILIFAGGFAAGWLFHPHPPSREPAPLPVLGQVPDYTLTNQLGQAVSSASFRGRVQAVTFLFTYCRGYCPLIAHNFMTLERLLKVSGKADKVQLVAFNVDPQNTGPSEMRAFQEQYGWKPDNHRWEFLTGSVSDIHHVVTDGYHVYYKKVVDEDDAGSNAMGGDSIPEPVVANKLADKAGVDYDIVHNDMLAIVDTQGRIRKIFSDADRVSDEQIMAVIERLLPDQPNAAH